MQQTEIKIIKPDPLTNTSTSDEDAGGWKERRKGLSTASPRPVSRFNDNDKKEDKCFPTNEGIPSLREESINGVVTHKRR
jgi:hypothetical protein